MDFYDSSRATHRVGLIELPELADLLHDCGVSVVDGEDYRQSVAAISKAFPEGRFPIIAADTTDATLANWLNGSASKGFTIAIVHEDGEQQNLSSAQFLSLSTPFSVNDLLVTLGLPPLNGAQGDEMYPELEGTEEDVLSLDALPEIDALPEPVTAAPVEEDPWNTPPPVQRILDPPEPTMPVQVLPQRVQAPIPQAPAPIPQAPAPIYMDTDSAGEQPAQVSEYQSAVIKPAQRTLSARKARVCPVVYAWSGKGGVGKTTTALQLAVAASEAGLKVILIDGNVGQGDIPKSLKINPSELPTIVNAIDGDYASCVMSPDSVTEARPQSLAAVNFGLVLAPAPEDEAGALVGPSTYREVVEYCRQRADLVICDTQIIEAVDRTGMVEQFILPSLSQDGWGVGITDQSNLGLGNLQERLEKLVEDGASPQRMFVYVNKVDPAAVEFTLQNVPSRFRGLGRFAGVVDLNPEVQDGMNRGLIHLGHLSLEALMRLVLLHITGDRRLEEVTPEFAVSGKNGLFGRLFRRRKRH